MRRFHFVLSFSILQVGQRVKVRLQLALARQLSTKVPAVLHNQRSVVIKLRQP